MCGIILKARMKMMNKNSKVTDKAIDEIFEVEDILVLKENFIMKKVRLITESGHKDYVLKRTKKDNLILN